MSLPMARLLYILYKVSVCVRAGLLWPVLTHKQFVYTVEESIVIIVLCHFSTLIISIAEASGSLLINLSIASVGFPSHR